MSLGDKPVRPEGKVENLQPVLVPLPQRSGLFVDQFGHWHYIPPPVVVKGA